MGFQKSSHTLFPSLEKSEDLLKEVINAIPDELLIINLDHTIALANDKVMMRCGGIDPDAPTLHCYQMHHGCDRPCREKGVPCPHETAIETKASVTLKHIHFDEFGNDIHFEITTVPRFDEEGNVIQTIQICRDITKRGYAAPIHSDTTEHISADEERHTGEPEVHQEQNREIPGALSHGIAHDLNNLLVGVLGNAELALDILPNESPVRACLIDIIASAKLAAGLTHQILMHPKNDVPSIGSAVESLSKDLGPDPLPGAQKPTDLSTAPTGTVLLVDDEETIRTVATHMIELIGCQVITASDGREALEIFKSNPDAISCVVLDLSMPHMDGESCLLALRRLKQDVRVILSSGYNEQEVMTRFKGVGLAGYIQKPYRMAQLRNVITAVMHLSALQKG